MVAPTEPQSLRALGEVGMLPERYGVDFLWHVRGWCGVQRKEVKDYIASMRDGRLARELEQMDPLRVKCLIVEGEWGVVGDTVLPKGVRRAQYGVKHTQFMSGLWAMQARGVMLTTSTSIRQTAGLVKMLEAWTQRETHGSLGQTRDVVPKNNWGRADNRAFQVHLLTGLPGVGVEMAGRIVDHFGGVPWTWEVTEEQLMEVEGIGKTRARRMMEAIGGYGNGT